MGERKYWIVIIATVENAGLMQKNNLHGKCENVRGVNNAPLIDTFYVTERYQ